MGARMNRRHLQMYPPDRQALAPSVIDYHRRDRAKSLRHKGFPSAMPAWGNAEGNERACLHRRHRQG